MAQIVKRKNKNGSTSYLFRVSTGYDRNEIGRAHV